MIIKNYTCLGGHNLALTLLGQSLQITQQILSPSYLPLSVNENMFRRFSAEQNNNSCFMPSSHTFANNNATHAQNNLFCKRESVQSNMTEPIFSTYVSVFYYIFNNLLSFCF